ncbi:hypothetical protein D5086_016319 [Populus alba]|uniref:Uncharacterized protein n=1 Tax=Populus alba TaxID=43335 RepID=A0ACC4BU75_POPAL
MNKGIWFSNNILLDLKSKSIPGGVNTGSLRRLKLIVEYLRNISKMKQPSTNIINLPEFISCEAALSSS